MIDITKTFTKEFIENTRQLAYKAQQKMQKTMPVQFLEEKDILPEVKYIKINLHFVGMLFGIRIFSYFEILDMSLFSELCRYQT